MNLIPQHRSSKRQGFTLIEMLVVIAIIAILAAMAAYAVFAMVGGQQRRNTESTITVLNKVLKAHWDAVIAEADADIPSPAVMSLANGDVARAKVLWRKVRLVEAFPQTYLEVGTPASPPWIYAGGYIPAGQQRYIASYQTQMNGLLAAKNPLSESGACLLMALSVARQGGATALAKDKIGSAVADTDGDGVPELIDSFDNPKQALAFFRFAYNTGAVSDNAQFKASNPTAGKNARGLKYPDPADADGALVNPAWFNSANRLTFEMWFHPVTNPYPWKAAIPPPPAGCYVAPVIVSAGPTAIIDPVTKTNVRPFGFTLNAKGYFSSADPLTAMQPDMSITNQAQANDNIYSFNLAGN